VLPRHRSLPLPKLWIGYTLAAVTFGVEMIAIGRHPELLDAADLHKGTPLPCRLSKCFFRVCSYVFWHGLHPVAITNILAPSRPTNIRSRPPKPWISFHSVFLAGLIFICPGTRTVGTLASMVTDARVGIRRRRSRRDGVQSFSTPGMGIVCYLCPPLVAEFLRRGCERRPRFRRAAPRQETKTQTRRESSRASGRRFEN